MFVLCTKCILINLPVEKRLYPKAILNLDFVKEATETKEGVGGLMIATISNRSKYAP